MTLPRPPSYSALFPPTTALAAFFPSTPAEGDAHLSAPTTTTTTAAAQRPPQRIEGRNAFNLDGFCSFAGVTGTSCKTTDWGWLDFARHDSDSDEANETTTDDEDELASPTQVAPALCHPTLLVRLPSATTTDGCDQLSLYDDAELVGSPMLETSFGFTDTLLESDPQPATPGALSLKRVLSYFSLPELPDVLHQSNAPDSSFVNANLFRSLSASASDDVSSQAIVPAAASHDDDTGADGDDEGSKSSDRLARRSSISKSNSGGVKSATRVSFSFKI